MNNNICYIAAAGAGKTTFIINKAAEAVDNENSNSVAIITLTTKNQENIRERVSKFPFRIAKRIYVLGWYEFLLKYIIRPYKGSVIPDLYDYNVSVIPDLYDYNVSMLWAEVNGSVKRGGKFVPRYKENDLKTKYLVKNKIYKNYLSEFASECINNNSPECMLRLRKIFSHIFIDEAQDMAGYDFDVIKTLCLSDISTITVGDPRQRTYSTNNLRKHKKYGGKIDAYFTYEVNKRRNTVVTIDDDSLNVSHRCGSEICLIASTIHPHYNATVPCHCESCLEAKSKFNNGLCKVYWVEENSISSFVNKFTPVALTRHRTQSIHASIVERMTMGESKGLGTNSVLIYPTSKMLEFFKSKTSFDELEMARLYVALTRATHIVGIVVPNHFKSSSFEIEYWSV